MKNQETHNESKKRRKWPWIVAGLLLVLIVGLRLSLKTTLVQNFVKVQIESAANNQLNAELQLGELKGDLWKEITLTGIRLQDKGETVASVDSLHTAYNIWSYFSDVFEVHEISIARPFIKIEQQDSVWNVSRWIKPDNSSNTSAGGSSFPLSIKSLKLKNGEIDAKVRSLPKDSAFTVADLSLDSSIDYYGDEFDIGISGFSFKIFSSSLGSAVRVESEARLSEESISLHKLVVATGNSILQTSGIVSLQDSTSKVQVEARPLSWKDVAIFADEASLRQDLSAELSISGSMQAFTLGLNVQADGLQQMDLDLDLSYDSSLTLNGVRAQASRISLPVLAGDSTLPEVDSFSFNADGNIPFDDIDSGEMEATLKIDKVLYDGYTIDEMMADISFSNRQIISEIDIKSGSQKGKIRVEANEIFEERPEVALDFTASNVNPGYWLKDKNYTGSINLVSKVSGSGFNLQGSPWNYSAEITDSRFLDQKFSLIQLNGKVSEQVLTNSSLIRFNKNEANIKAEVRQFTGIPSFNYSIDTQDFDLSEFINIEDFTSSISGNIEGKGKGNSLENLQLSSTLKMDSSVVNGEYISKLNVSIEVEDTVATVSEAALRSTIADGSFDARLHLLDFYRTTNNLNLNIEIKDLRSLAPLVGTDKLMADGTVKGDLSPINGRNLKFMGNVSLSNINFDQSFTARTAQGNIEATITEEPEYVIDLNLSSPGFSSVNLQDFNIQTRGKVQSQKVEGTFDLAFSGPQEGGINHSGHYTLAEDSSVVETTELQLESSLRTLSLQRPFQLLVKNQAVQMDTMSLQSTDGASLRLAVPYADSLNQEMFLSGKNLDIAVLQNALLSEVFVEGIMSGSLTVNRADTAVTANGELELTGITYQETVLDELIGQISISDGYLNSNLVITDNGKEIINGGAEVPFTLEQPSRIDDNFFNQPIDGFLRINQVALNNFEKLLESAGITETEGTLSFDGSLDGRAGMPKLTGNLNIDEAVLSGVKVDSVTANLDYDHEQSEINLNAAVNSLKQKAADVTAIIPFYINMLTFEVSMPEGDDQLLISLETNKFNLAALNDFVNPEQVRNIQGQLDGMVKVTGAVDDLKTNGELKLSKGSVRIVPAGIDIKEMSSRFIFEPNQMRIVSFGASSGSGKLTGDGEIALEKLIPGQVDISVSAKNFRAANTRDYSAIINLGADIGGTFTSPSISGNLKFLNGFVELKNFGEKSVEQVSLDSTATPETSSAIYDSLALDIDVSFERRFFVRNERYLEMEVELDGQVDLLKEANKDLRMFGTITAASGYALPLGKRFEIEEGVITFSGNPEDPSVNVRSLYEPPQPEEEIKIWYIIEGTVEDPKFKYESQPEMELESIISYTLFGQPFYKLDSWQQVVANSGSKTTAADVAMEVLLDRVETLATRKLGIDVVKIDNTLAGGQNGTSITTGWYISPKIFFAIQNVITGSTPNTGFMLEYKLRQNLKLILSQGNDSRQGIDLKWNHDY